MSFTLMTAEYLKCCMALDSSIDKRFKDFKRVSCSLPGPEFETVAYDQNKWWHTIPEGTKIFQEHSMSWANVWKAEIIDPAIH